VLLLIVRCRCERALKKERTFFATTNFREGVQALSPHPTLSQRERAMRRRRLHGYLMRQLC